MFDYTQRANTGEYGKGYDSIDWNDSEEDIVPRGTLLKNGSEGIASGVSDMTTVKTK